MEIGVEDFAARHGISEQVARRYAERGQVPARKVSSRWLFSDEDELPITFSSRPLSQKSASHLRHLLASGEVYEAATGEYLARLRRQFRQLEQSTTPGTLLRSWFRNSLRVERFAIDPERMDVLERDAATKASGVSFYRPRLPAASRTRQLFECHVPLPAKSFLLEKHSLVGEASGNVLIHWIDRGRWKSTIRAADALIELSWHQDSAVQDLVRQEVRRLCTMVREHGRFDPPVDT
jgi:DNA-binding transcriptional MerR regulator